VPLVSAAPRTVGRLACGTWGAKAWGSLAPPVGSAVGAVAVAAGDGDVGEEWVGVA